MMKIRRAYILPACMTVLGIGALATTLAVAQPKNDPKAPAGMPEMKLPPGYTPEDMQKCMMAMEQAGTPGKQQQILAESAGTWTGPAKFWMAPGAEVMTGDCTVVLKPIWEGRYTTVEVTSNCPAMGEMKGLGAYAYDNVGGKFQSTWIDSHSTQIMNGTGDISSDGKTMTWTYTMNCPVTKKPTTLREVIKTTGKDTQVMEFYMADVKTGKEFKGMEVTLTRKGGAPAAKNEKHDHKNDKH